MMIDEIQMMKFKIKPVSGDVFHLNLTNYQFIEMVWSMGKLEEVVQKEFYKLSGSSKAILLRLFDNLYEQFQTRLNKVSLKDAELPSVEDSSKLEIEIFKEHPRKKLN